jgi:hypothetical protein
MSEPTPPGPGDEPDPTARHRRRDPQTDRLRAVIDPTRGQITITAEQIRTWTRRALTPQQLRHVEAAIPHSSIPEAIAVILDAITE